MTNSFTKPINYISTILFKLKQDVKQSLEYIYDGSKLLQQQFEKIHGEITAYSTKDNAMWREQAIVSAQKGHNLDTEQRKYTEKRNVLLEQPVLLSAITIKCAAQAAAKVTRVMFHDLARTKCSLLAEKNPTTDTILSPSGNLKLRGSEPNLYQLMTDL